MGKQFGCKYKVVQNLVHAWARSQAEVAKLSGIVRNEKDIKGPFTWTLKEIPVLYIHKVQSFL